MEKKGRMKRNEEKKKGVRGRTDQKHGARGGLRRQRQDGDHGAAAVDGVPEEVEEPDAGLEPRLGREGRFHLGEFLGHRPAGRPEPRQRLLGRGELAPGREPARALGDEEERDEEDPWDDVYDPQRDDVGVAVGQVLGGVVDEVPDKGACVSWCPVSGWPPLPPYLGSQSPWLSSPTYQRRSRR